MEHYNHLRAQKSAGNIIPADVYFGHGEAILQQQARITGKKLSHYFGANLPGDSVIAHPIMNGTNKAESIADFVAFLTALNGADYTPGAVAVPVPTAPIEVVPKSPLVTPRPWTCPAPVAPAPNVQTGGFWSAPESLFIKKTA